MEIYETTYGRRHLYTAKSMEGQAEAERHLGERESARRLYEEALEVLERHYGPDHDYCRAIREGLRLLEE